MCGEHGFFGLKGREMLGSSPHVRGAPSLPSLALYLTRIIPACAGSTWRALRDMCQRGDHPRMCGEHGVGADAVGRNQGSSPHVRGARP